MLEEPMDADVLAKQYKMLRRDQQKQVESMVTAFLRHPALKRQAGVLKGKIKMSEDFDAPLEEFADYI